MPQAEATLARVKQCLKAYFLGVLTYFQGPHSIGNMLVFTIIFDVGMKHIELKFRSNVGSYSFSFTFQNGEESNV